MLTQVKYLKDYSYGTGFSKKNIKAGQQLEAFKIGNKIYADSAMKYEITPIVQEIYKEYVQTITDNTTGEVKTQIVSNIVKPVIKPTTTQPTVTSGDVGKQPATTSEPSITEEKKVLGLVSKKTAIILIVIIAIIVTGLIIFRKKIF